MRMFDKLFAARSRRWAEELLGGGELRPRPAVRCVRE